MAAPEVGKLEGDPSRSVSTFCRRSCTTRGSLMLPCVLDGGWSAQPHAILEVNGSQGLTRDGRRAYLVPRSGGTSSTRGLVSSSFDDVTKSAWFSREGSQCPAWGITQD